MPQLDFSTFASQIFWLAVTFTFLYLLLAYSGLPKIRSVLQNRREKITNDLEQAERLKQEAQSAENDFTSAIKSARKEAAQAIASARQAAKEEEVKRAAKLDETFARQMEESERRIKLVRESALEVVTPSVTESVVKITEDLAGISLKGNEVKKAIADSLEAKKLLPAKN